ncbi:hypothetical protein, partial [Tenuifilum sp.]|nr:hypothetical protein [Tenuifilum sp.]
MREITTLTEFTEQIKGKERVYLLVYKKGTGVSDCAFSAVKEAAEISKMENVFYVDAPTYPEIHKYYG